MFFILSWLLVDFSLGLWQNAKQLQHLQELAISHCDKRRGSLQYMKCGSKITVSSSNILVAFMYRICKHR